MKSSHSENNALNPSITDSGALIASRGSLPPPRPTERARADPTRTAPLRYVPCRSAESPSDRELPAPLALARRECAVRPAGGARRLARLGVAKAARIAL